MFNKYLNYFALVLALAFIVSCSDDDSSNNPSTTSESLMLAEYVESTTDYVNTYAPAMILASDVKTGVTAGNVFVMDIRSADAYAAGHIPSAVNVAATDVINYYESNNLAQYDKVAVACYSGQTASYVTGVLRVLGYDNVYTLKFGMCSWSQETNSSWPSNIGSGKAALFTSDATDKAAAGDMPTINTGKGNGADILRDRAEEIIAAGFGEAKISNDEVFANKDNLYIINYWKMDHYLDPGHIPGAIQYTPKEDLKLNTFLKTLPTDKTIVVYCYTGQTSAHVSAYLRMLGYDAKSLLFGANGMIYNDMLAGGLTHWDDKYCMGYELEK